MCYVLHDAAHRPAEQLVIFVVHRDDDEELGLARGIVETLSEGVLVILPVSYMLGRRREGTYHKVIGIASDGGVAHLFKLVAIAVGALI